MNKGLEALKKIKWKLEDEGILGEEYELCDIIEKELKALEIINKKGLNVLMFKAHFIINKPEYEEYQYYLDNCEKYGFSAFYLTRQEFELLKGVLL